MATSKVTYADMLCVKLFNYFWSKTDVHNKDIQTQRVYNVHIEQNDSAQPTKCWIFVANGIVIAFVKQWIEIAFKILCVCSVVRGMNRTEGKKREKKIERNNAVVL